MPDSWVGKVENLNFREFQKKNVSQIKKKEIFENPNIWKPQFMIFECFILFISTFMN